MNLASRSPRRARTLAAAAALGAALVLSGCGMNVQTLQTYTPAHGVNVDEANVKVRNLLIVANDSGAGVLSGSFVPDADETLRSVSGKALDAHNVDAGALSVSGGPVQLKKGTITVLTDGDPIKVSAAQLKPGLLAEVTLTYGSGSTTTMTVPVLSASDPVYKDVATKIG